MVFPHIIPIMENQTEKNMEAEIILGLYRG